MDSDVQGHLRVLHVIPSVAPRYGGPSYAVVEMCRALRFRGVDTLLATTDADGDGHLDVRTGQATSYAGVPAIFFRRQWSEALKYSSPLARWLDTHAHDYGVVHIHAVFSHSCLAAARACQRHGVPYLVRPLGTLDPWSVRQKPLRKRLFWQLGVARMLDRASAIHYTAVEEQRLAESSLGLKRGVVVPLGVGLDMLDAGEDANQFRARFPAVGSGPYVLALSRLHPKKGLDQLVRAFLDLRQERGFADWRLVVAGDGDPAYRRQLERLVAEGAGEDQILFVGWLEGQDKLSALRGAGLFALPSYQENFAIAAVEAMACGVPVLLGEHVNLAPEVAAAGAGWVTNTDSAVLTSALRDILSSGPERLRRGAAARQLAIERFTWASVAEQLEQLYEAVKCGRACESVTSRR